jgi:hypothetical protein
VDGLPAAVAAEATAEACKVYADEWRAAVAEGKAAGTCVAGFCGGNGFAAAGGGGGAPVLGFSFARPADYWAAHGDEAASVIDTLGGGKIALW